MFTTGAPRREPGGRAGHWSPRGLPVAYKAGRLPADKRVRSAPTHHTPAHGGFPDNEAVSVESAYDRSKKVSTRAVHI